MTQPIKPALTAEEWGTPHALDPNEREEFYTTPRKIAARCLYGQAFGFTREDVDDCQLAASQYEQSAKRYRGERDGGITAEAHEKLATRFRDRAGRIGALLPPGAFPLTLPPDSAVAPPPA
jgi:hypothetical protein